MQGKGILKSKTYLYLTEFFAGMSVMAVELGASRLLAPYFSSSQIVWTIIIGTIMIAMALGNIFGGRSADKDPNPDRLYGRILFAAVWIGLIPVVGKYIILGISALLIFSVNSNFLIWAAFVSCMAVFVFPLFLLGTVTPSLAKYTMDSLDDNGRTVGLLGAFNTIGSIIGTFVPTFVTIPSVGTSITFLIFGGILLLLAVVYFLSTGNRNWKLVLAAVLFAASCVFGRSDSFAFWDHGLLYEGESVYNYLQVSDNETETILSTNVLFGVQSIYKKEKGMTGLYYDYAMAAPLMADIGSRDTLQTLVLGMGSGTYATQCSRYFDNMQIEGVEIDDKITALARRYFELPENVQVTSYDGRAYLDAIDRKYDVIMVDAYQDITIPFQMSTIEFFTQVREHLNEGGVMVVNMNMRDTEEGNINEYLADTISAVFPHVYTADVPHCTNRELFASVSGDMMTALQRNISAQRDSELRAAMVQLSADLKKYDAGSRCMTDDKAPVEVLGMRMIDDIIQDEMRYYKDIYAQNGIQGVLDSFG